MTRNELIQAIGHETNEELEARLKKWDFLINLFDEQCSNEARWPARKRALRQQQEWINDFIGRRKQQQRQEQGIPEPEPCIVGVKALRVFGEVKNHG